MSIFESNIENIWQSDNAGISDTFNYILER